MLSAVCPCFNEEAYIQHVLAFFVQAKPSAKELLIVDGGSTDRTREIVSQFASIHPNIHLLDNPHRYVPFALNIGISNSNGDPIVRLDVHTEYASDFFERVIETLQTSGADIVGGPILAVGKTSFQKMVAKAVNHPFGVGGSRVHDSNYAGGNVDTVFPASYRRQVFEDVGLFDERLIRNQDDEFHYRARSLGKSLYLNPEIKSFYYPRDSARGLFKQYFQYGLYKPLVLRKVKSGTRLRHLLPSVFVLYLLALPGCVFLYASFVWLLPLFAYLVSSAIISLRLSSSFLQFIYGQVIFPAIHCGYGLGFLIGMVKPPPVQRSLDERIHQFADSRLVPSPRGERTG